MEGTISETGRKRSKVQFEKFFQSRVAMFAESTFIYIFDDCVIASMPTCSASCFQEQ